METQASKFAHQSVRELAEVVKRQLAMGGCERPDLDTALLFKLGLGIDSTGGWPERTLSGSEVESFHGFWGAIEACVPIPYLVGRTTIGGFPVEVTKDVLVPGPETELLIDLAVDVLSPTATAAGPFIDVCTGSGVIAVCMAARLPRAFAYALDISASALAVVRRNAARLGVLDRVQTCLGDLFRPLDTFRVQGKGVMITANPPYVRRSDIPALPVHLREHTPRISIDGGDDGLLMHSRVIAESWRYLRNEGYLVLENEDGQSADVQRLLLREGHYRIVTTGRNEKGVERVIIAQRSA
jgi:release factor glutamine methyltransferase